MNIALNWYSVTLLFGFAHGLLFAALHFFRAWRQQRQSDGLLGFLLLQASLLILPYMLGFMGINTLWETLLFFPQDPGLLIGPTLYFYLMALTQSDFRFQGRHLIHLIPFGLVSLYQLIVFFMGPDFVRQWLAEVHHPYLSMPLYALTFLSNITYLIAGIVYFRRYRSWVETEFADPQRLKFGWIFSFLCSLTIAIMVSWGFDAFDLWGGGLTYTDAYWKFLGISGFIYILGLSGYLQAPPAYLSYRPHQPKPQPAPTPDPQTQLEQKLLHFMTEERPYLNTTVSITDVALRIGTNKTTLSQLINSRFDKNFNQFINHYRVEAFKQQVVTADLDNTTLLGIAMNCGFNSKATFNRVFKNLSGITPKAYAVNSRNHQRE